MATQAEGAIRRAGLHILNLEETGRKLGEGSYGEVVEVRVRGRRCAGKKLHKVFCERDVPPEDTAAIAQRFEEECRRMPHLKHRNIVQMIGVHFHPRTRQPTLVMELMDTSLTRYLEERAAVPPTVKHSILLGVASGLVYLHTLSPPLGPIVHRDLTANNVLLNLGEDVIAKIADLGQARIAGRNPAQMTRWTKCPGNVDHMPPEALIDDPEYGTALDVFSFGVVMLHTLAHEWPEPLSQVDAARRVRSEVDRRKTYLDKIEGSLLKPLVVECLSDSAERRPAAGELTGALKLAMKLHPQMQSIREAHEEVLHQVHDLQQQLQQQLQEQQQARQLSLKNQELTHQMNLMTEAHAHQVEDLQNKLEAQQAREQQQTKVLKQQVRQLELKHQELVQEFSEQQQEIQRHIQEKELLHYQPTFVDPYPQNVPPTQDSNHHDMRKEIIQGIRGIQPVAGNNLHDVEVPQRLYKLAKEVAKKERFHIRFKLIPVYRLLLNHIHEKGQGSVVLPQAEATLAGWQQASKALFRYALNLVLAPKRPEFKKMKLSSSFYVYNISRNLHEAEQVFMAMGYQVVERQERGGQDLVYEGEVNTQKVLDTATDLLVMHEEIGLIRELVARGGGHVTLEQAIMQQYQMNTVQNTRSAGAHPQPLPLPHPQSHPQPQSGYSGHPPGGGEGSHCLGSDRGTSGGVLPQAPHQMAYGQPPQPVGQPQPPTAQGPHGAGGYERGVFALLPLEAGVVVANQQQRQQHRDGPFHPEHEKLHEVYGIQGGTAYANVALAARGGDQPQHVAGHSTGGGARPSNPLPQMHAQGDTNVQRSGQPQGVDHTYHPGQVPPGPAHAPVHEPPPDATLYENFPGSESAMYQNATAMDLLQLQANSERNLGSTTVTQEMRKLIQQYPELAGLPPQQKDTERPASDDDSLDLYGDDSNQVPVDTQQGPEYQRQQQRDYRPSKPPSTDSNMSSIDIYGSPQSKQFQRAFSRGRSTSTDSKESSIDIYTSGSAHKLAKCALHPVHEEPTNPPSDPAPLSPSPLPRGPAHPLETKASPSPAYVPKSPPTQKSSCDLPPNAPVMGISPRAAAAAKLRQRDGLFSNPPSDQPLPSQPPSGQLLYGQPPIQRVQHRQPPRELPTTHPPSDQRIVSPPGPLPPKSAPSVSTNTAAAETIDASETDQSDLDQHRPNRHSRESLEKNLGQDNSKLRRQEPGKQPVRRKKSHAISESSKPHRKSSQLSSSAEYEEGDEGGSTDATTAADLEEQCGFSLGDTWVCSYCTNLVKANLHACDICGRERQGTAV